MSQSTTSSSLLKIIEAYTHQQNGGGEWIEGRKKNTSPYKYYGSGNIYTFHAFHIPTGFPFAHFWHLAIWFYL